MASTEFLSFSFKNASNFAASSSKAFSSSTSFCSSRFLKLLIPVQLFLAFASHLVSRQVHIELETFLVFWQCNHADFLCLGDDPLCKGFETSCLVRHYCFIRIPLSQLFIKRDIVLILCQ